MSAIKPYLDQEIEFLKGVGPSRGDLLRTEIGIHTFRDLLEYYPFRYVDKSKITPIVHARAENGPVQLKGKLVNLTTVPGKKKRLEGYLSDGSGTLKLVWFQKVQWVEKVINIGDTYLVYGKINDFKGNYSMVHPEMERTSYGSQPPLSFDPVYSTTEKLSKKGLDAKGIRKLVGHLFEKMPPAAVTEILPADLVRKLKLPDLFTTLNWIHFPTNQEQAQKATLRLKFQELFLLQLNILKRRNQHAQKFKGHVFGRVGTHFKTFYAQHLDFELTGAQKRVLKEIRADLGRGVQMNRLLQGDVGAGKTIVGFLSMLMAIDNGFQTCLLAPTEVLAKQHYTGIRPMMEALGLKCTFLSGSIKGKERKQILAELASGETHTIIGTHALLEDPVVFTNLGLTIIDEQHRFGVAQRARLWKKGKGLPPHVLVMTATPIPRTLAMTLYGDLHVSILDELPPGRKPVTTIHRRDASRPQLNRFLKEQIRQGRQIFMVYPLIEESSKLDLQNLMEGYDRMLLDFPPPDYRLAVVHGKMKPEDKDAEMNRFAQGKADIMVATTVIEVGVNVPNASVMVIENAERFGLSQLHQLRGRVGRGANQSYCILLTSQKLSKDGIKRMKTMTETNDGFKIAEVDLEIRGPGNIEGTQQSGVLHMKMANLATDGKIVETARHLAEELLERDPQLSKPEHIPLKAALKKGHSGIDWAHIS